MLVIVGASGKLGFATLTALLDRKLLSAQDIVCTTSSSSGAAKLQSAANRGVTIRNVSWDDPPERWDAALRGCKKLLLISSSRIDRDYGEDHPGGSGREADHMKALEAVKRKDATIEHVYYTSLAFANPSKSRVMQAHQWTERWLRESLNSSDDTGNKGVAWTILREGLYNESWPLYFGYYVVPSDDRRQVIVAGDGKISWTSITDLGLATAVVLAAPSKDWRSRTVYLSQAETHTLHEVAMMVSRARGSEVNVKIVSRAEYERHYIEDRGMNADMVHWWAATYNALPDGECEVKDATLYELLKSQGVKSENLATTVESMIRPEGR
jgi:uncharacterized protein YbjT (DUF2867 family)